MNRLREFETRKLTQERLSSLSALITPETSHECSFIFKRVLVSAFCRMRPKSTPIFAFKDWKNFINKFSGQEKYSENLNGAVSAMLKISNHSNEQDLISTFQLLTRQFNVRMTEDILLCLLKGSSSLSLLDMARIVQRYEHVVKKVEVFIPLIKKCAPVKSKERRKLLREKYDQRLWQIDSKIKQLGLKHNLFSYTAMLQVVLEAKRFTTAEKILESIESEFKLDEACIMVVLKHCNTIYSFPLAMKWFRELYKIRTRPSFEAYKYILSSAVRAKDQIVPSLFWECRKVGIDQVVINLMIKWALNRNSDSKALMYFKLFDQNNLKPNYITFKIFISSATKTRNSERAKVFFDMMDSFSIPKDNSIISKMIRAYLLDGKTREAFDLLQETSEKYLSQSIQMPNSLSISYLEVLLALSQIPTRKATMQYYSLYKMAEIYYGQNMAHRKWLHRLKRKPAKRLGDRRDRFSLRAFLYDSERFQ